MRLELTSMPSLALAVLLCTTSGCAKTTGEAETGASETDASGDGDGDGDPGGDGDGDPGNCTPRQPELQFDWTHSGGGELDWSCTIDELQPGPGLHLSLDCPDLPEPLTLDIDATPELAVDLAGDETLRVRVSIRDWAMWVNNYLRVDVEGGPHLVTVIDSSEVEPEAFELPIPFSDVTGQCATSEEFCGPQERMALAFAVEGGPVEVFDGNYAELGGDPAMQVWVDEATRYTEFECTDGPNDWYRVLYVGGP